MFVVVTGPPGSGKSTLAPQLASRLELPLLAKDELKQALLEQQGAADVEASRELGRDAVRRLLAEAREAGRGVLDSVWVDRTAAVRQLSALPDVVEVFCRADLATLRRRYAERAASKGPGHFDEERPASELWPQEAMEPLAGPWPVVEVDTTRAVDLEALVEAVRRRRSPR